MSNKNSLENEKVGFSVHGYTGKKFQYLEGKFRTMIETLGLSEKQEKSFSDLIIGELWNMFDKPQFHYQYEGLEGDINAKLIIK